MLFNSWFKNCRCGLRNGAIGIGAGIAGTAGTPAVADATIAGAAGTAAAVPVVGAAPTAAAGAAAVAPTVGTVPATAIGTAGVAPATGTAAAAPAVETVGGATSTTGTGRGFSKVW